MENDRIDGIFDFVGNAAGDASAGGEAAGHFDFIANAADGFGVTHDEERADLRAFLGNKIQRDLNATAGGGDELALRGGTPALECVEDGSGKSATAGENLSGGFSQQFAAGHAEEALDRGADQHYARVAGKEHKAILQRGHELAAVV